MTTVKTQFKDQEWTYYKFIKFSCNCRPSECISKETGPSIT